jgi:hypothetical protein
MRLPHLPALVLALAAILCSPADLEARIVTIRDSL